MLYENAGLGHFFGYVRVSNDSFKGDPVLKSQSSSQDQAGFKEFSSASLSNHNQSSSWNSFNHFLEGQNCQMGTLRFGETANRNKPRRKSTAILIRK